MVDENAASIPIQKADQVAIARDIHVRRSAGERFDRKERRLQRDNGPECFEKCTRLYRLRDVVRRYSGHFSPYS